MSRYLPIRDLSTTAPAPQLAQTPAPVARTAPGTAPRAAPRTAPAPAPAPKPTSVPTPAPAPAPRAAPAPRTAPAPRAAPVSTPKTAPERRKKEPDADRMCAVCNAIVTRGSFLQHVRGRKHQKELAAAMQRASNAATATPSAGPASASAQGQRRHQQQTNSKHPVPTASASAKPAPAQASVNTQRSGSDNASGTPPTNSRRAPDGNVNSSPEAGSGPFNGEDLVKVEPAAGLDFGLVDVSTVVRGSSGVAQEKILKSQFTIEGAPKGAVKFLGLELYTEIQLQLGSTLTNSSNNFTCTLRGGGGSSIKAGDGSLFIDAEFKVPTAEHWTPYDAGQYQAFVCITFACIPLKSKKTFTITRKVSAVVGSMEDHEALGGDWVPYSKKQKRKYVPFQGFVFKSNRPEIWTPVKWVITLPGYDIPKYVKENIFGDKVLRHSGGDEDAPAKRYWGDSDMFREARKFMPPSLAAAKYSQFFEVLLWVEEEQNTRDLEQSSMFKIQIKPSYGQNYRVEVPFKLQKQVGLLIGNFILASRSDEANVDPAKRNWYQGRIQKITEMAVDLAFPGDFSLYKGSTFDVRFSVNRMPYRRMHHGVNEPIRLRHILFPTSSDLSGRKMSQREIRDIEFTSRLLVDNAEQKEAVAAVLHRTPGTVPFIIFGPPGTGKTFTLSESIQQILKENPAARIIACAPSNKGADVLTAQLGKNLKSDQLLRLNAMWRPVGEYPKSLKEFAVINQNDVFAMPSLEDLKTRRVIVTTCISAGAVVGLGMGKNYFTHIFIDEAGQGSEPEIMVPIAGLASAKTVIVLAGDNKQLGPTIFAKLANKLGLGKSYLSRLMDLPLYELTPETRGRNIVKLVKNFRSHPSILEYSNLTFYASELQPCGDPAHTHRFANLEILPKKGFPLLFHNVIGKDQQDSDSPSYFNVEEATMVKLYCEKLLGMKKSKITPDDIGIITPYRAQKDKLQQLFGHYSARNMPGLKEIKVGSVEEFQGDEKSIIIISTVRGNPSHVASDLVTSLGFVASPQRLNVALTRARSLLIVIGHAPTLSLDFLWGGFISLIMQNNAFLGPAFRPSGGASATGNGAEESARLEKLKAKIVRKHREIDAHIVGEAIQSGRWADDEDDGEDDDSDEEGRDFMQGRRAAEFGTDGRSFERGGGW